MATVLAGSAEPDTLTALNGEDCILRGYGGADLLSGASGDDSLYGGDGADRLTSRGGNDQLSGGLNDLTGFRGLAWRDGTPFSADGSGEVRQFAQAGQIWVLANDADGEILVQSGGPLAVADLLL